MDIEVFARIPADDKITIQFANLTLEKALKKFSTNYAYITDSKKKQGNITHIVVVPEGQQPNLYLKEIKKSEPKNNNKKDIAEEKASKPEPFKFEFDPSKFSINNQ